MMTHTLLLDPQSGSTQETFRASLAPDLANQFDQVMQRARSFFLQHPDQDYYVHPSTSVEVLEGQALGKEVHEQAPGLVEEVVPGSRIRLTILDDRPPLVEEFRIIQQQLRHEIGAKGSNPQGPDSTQSKISPQSKGLWNQRVGAIGLELILSD